MKLERSQKVLIGVAIGIQLGLSILPGPDAQHPKSFIDDLILGGKIIAIVMLIKGLANYAKVKGYTSLLGILGFLSCAGLLVVALLPDKNKVDDVEDI